MNVMSFYLGLTYDWLNHVKRKFISNKHIFYWDLPLGKHAAVA